MIERKSTLDTQTDSVHASCAAPEQHHDRPWVTLFAIPKPFDGTIATIQQNAIHSWSRLDGPVEIILFGQDEDLQIIASNVGATVLPIRVNENGTPILSDAFSRVHQVARGEFLLYANSDLLFDSDLLEAVQRFKKSAFSSFLAMGRRVDWNLHQSLDIETDELWRKLFESAGQSGRPCSIVCKDYFLFTRDLFRDIPDLLVGRGNWDNWIVHRAKHLGAPVIDLSHAVLAVHQTHGHQHVEGGRRTAYITGAEAKHNQRLCGGRHLLSGSTANWRLVKSGFIRNRFPWWAMIKDLPRFLTLLRNLLFLRYIFVVSAFFT